MTTSTDDKRVVEVECTNLTNDPDAWSTEQIAAIERESIEYWAKIEDPEKRAVAVIARDCLIRLLENPLEWLPTSIKPEGGARFSLFVYVSVDALEKEVIEMREHAEKELYAQVHDLAGIRDDLREGADHEHHDD